MKKIVALAILGTAATSAFGQGHIDISNYLAVPYNQVVWGSGVPGHTGGQAVNSTDVQLQIWYGAGVVADAGLLTAGVTFTVAPSLQFDPGKGAGPGGYFPAITQAVPFVGEGTFQIRAFGTATGAPPPGGSYTGASVLWQATSGTTANPPPIASVVPGLEVGFIPVPEPSTFALAGLGAAALLIFRRRA